MRRFTKLICVWLLLCVLLPLTLQAGAEGYTYTVRLFAGNRGMIDGKSVAVYEGLHYGDRLTFDPESVQVKEGEKYYVRGFRESGLDNAAVGTPSFPVTGDRDYVVAYGVRGEQVAYTVRYLDTNGRELLPSRTCYGNVGDRPVVAFLYVEGYRPQAYNLTKTLSENAAENVFEFLYTRESAQAQRGNASGAAASNGGQPSYDAAEPNAQLAAIGEVDANGPAELLDLDRSPEGQTEIVAATEKSGGLPVWAWAPVVLLLIGLCVLLFRLRARGGRKH